MRTKPLLLVGAAAAGLALLSWAGPPEAPKARPSPAPVEETNLSWDLWEPIQPGDDTTTSSEAVPRPHESAEVQNSVWATPAEFSETD